MKKTNQKNSSSEPMADSNTLSDIARGIQHAVNSVQQLVEQYYDNVLEKYTNEKIENNKFIVKLPDDHILEVPKITLLNYSHLLLDEMIVNLSVRINSIKKKINKTSTNKNEMGSNDGLGVGRTSFDISFASDKAVHEKDSDVIGLTMKFKAGNPPEAIHKIVEEFTRTIVPKKIARETDTNTNPKSDTAS